MNALQDHQSSQPPVVAFLHLPRMFTPHCGMYPLVEALGATPVIYEREWVRFQARVERIGWRAGRWIQRVGQAYSGSAYNAVTPVWDEFRFARRAGPGSVAHFIWGEYAAPRWPGYFRRKGARVVCTFHSTPGNVEQILGRIRDFSKYDWITTMTKTVVPFFIERGMPAERVTPILHGVDTQFFTPGEGRAPHGEGPLRGIIVGGTDRDHAFMASVVQRTPPEVFQLAVLVRGAQREHYRSLSGVRMFDWLPEEDLREAYRNADLLSLPMVNAAANNAFLEAMACGTPVLTNRVGGVPEYVSADSSYIMEGKKVDEWVDLIVSLSRNREDLFARRARVRVWAERFDWHRLAEEYREVYRRVTQNRRLEP